MSQELSKVSLPQEITSSQVELITRTIAQGATPDELQLYFYDCKRRGVHPMDKKIHFTKRGGKYVPIVGIDFLREQAAKTGQCAGISDAEFVGTPKAPGFASTVTVKRMVGGEVCEFTATARWEEYCPASGQDHMWQKMPHTMLAKCAEALALRKAFPGEEIGQLYIEEEMEQAVDVTPKPRQQRPSADAGPIVPKTSFFKEWGGKPWADVPRDQLDWYAEAIHQNIEDPAKARFKAQNQATLEQIIAAIDANNKLNAELDAQAAEE